MNVKEFDARDRLPRTILVADDEPAVLRLLKELLMAVGYDVLTAEDGVEALIMFQQHKERISLCILDAMMPRAGGDKVFYTIRQEKENMPVIFISGYACEENKMVGNHIGMLAKPLKMESLLRMVSGMMSDSEQPTILPALVVNNPK